MINFKSFVQRSLLAAALILGASPAFAGPVYHVSINTAGIVAPGALMAFDFISDANADSANATLTNFSGAFGDEDGRGTGVTDIAGGYLFVNGLQGYLTRGVTLGGRFGFDITFSDSIGGAVDALFNVSLLASDFSPLGTVDGIVASFALLAPMNGQPSELIISPNNDFAAISEAVAEVPEPSELLLMLTGLALAGCATRRSRGYSK